MYRKLIYRHINTQVKRCKAQHPFSLSARQKVLVQAQTHTQSVHLRDVRENQLIVTVQLNQTFKMHVNMLVRLKSC